MNTLLRRSRLLSVLLITGLLLAASASVATAADYEISHYEVTVELVPDEDGELRDAAITLLATYDIHTGPKSDGFKYLGELPVKDISVTDGSGKRLNHTLEKRISVTDGSGGRLKHPREKRKENKLTWFFGHTLAQGEQTIIARFTLVGALEGDLESNQLTLGWVKNWQVPVKDVTYRFLLPQGYAFDELALIPTKNRTTEIVTWQDRRCIESHFPTLLTERPLVIAFAPGVADSPAFSISRLLSWVWDRGELVIFALAMGFAVLADIYERITGHKLFPNSGKGSGGTHGGGGGGGGGG